MIPFPDFHTFFKSIWGYDPFPWQVRMAEQTATGIWPEWVTLPTGTGKTTVLDIAIYNLARQSAEPSDPRTAPVRIIFAVNRRIVVDEAYERAKTIANRLKTALTTPDDPIHPVALALQNLSGIENGAPLETYPLRGATFTDHSWARTPTQPLVISTTLDQLGSRLLFRGYGVSANSRPIHAALLANDALLILDEAHTAKAFSQTLQSVAVLRKQATQEIKLPFAAVQLTATPPLGVRDPFSLDEIDRNNSIIAARLSASKPTELVPVVEGAKGKARHKKLADDMGAKAISFLADNHRRVLIVVNRVATAEALAVKLKKGHDAKVLLLTGRLRPLDRDILVKNLNDTYQLKSNNPAPDVPKLILIATQCIEVGADFDFDALISELAPLDSLRQRFGRLNRQGRDIPAPAAIFTPEEAIKTPDTKKLLAELKKTRSRDLLVCARTNNSKEAEELEIELKKLSRFDGEESDTSQESRSSKWLSYITEDELGNMMASINIKKFLTKLYDKSQNTIKPLLTSRPIGEWNRDGCAVLLCHTETNVGKSKHFVIKKLDTGLLATIDESGALDDEGLADLCQKFAKSVLNGLKKPTITLIPVPKDFDPSPLYDALSEVLLPRNLEIHRLEQSTSHSEIQRLCSVEEIDCIQKDPSAARRIIIIPRDCHFIATPHAQQNLGNGEDPIYDTTLPEVWSWLTTLESPDLGLNAIASHLPTGANLTSLLAPSADAPILLAPHLDLLCQTSPEPHVSPDPSLYIHGPGRNFPEVSVILRADIADPSIAADILRTVPPLGTEAATVPLHHARTWLEKPTATNDNSGDAPEQSPDERSKGELAVIGAFRFSSGEAILLQNSKELQPGDTLVLQSQTNREWLEALFPLPEPKKNEPCPLDQYERAYLLSRDRLSIRFHKKVRDELRQHLADEDARSRFEEITTPLFAHDEEEERWVFREKDWTKAIPGLAGILANHLPDHHPSKSIWTYAAARPADDWKAIPFPAKSIDGVLITNRSRVGATPWPLDPADLGRQGNASNATVLLTAHSEAVSSRAQSNAKDLSGHLCHTLRDAGAWHDLGKLDPRFQAMLHGCSLQAAAAKPAIAKSEPRSQAMAMALLKLTELPAGFRHELLSALIVAESKTFAAHPEPDLLLHLIASHHGRCRAIAPVVHDTNPEPFVAPLDSETIRFAGKDSPLAHISEGVARRFWQLTRRFGWWGLPYLESLLRLADQYESSNPTKP